ncbi:alpha/beta hydrolase [Streptomyces kaniharaensis]|uniref:Alpha/beta hydrolase n=1 Tax=Streptomyces kaniharaensis TaxID=212423 RepID=A0A6N7KP91_9ACTN|nr:dienelactone hydrolase family protein [Streptomyces kaniharaensis]MQS13346.1 alpha/beta hydrolase [Streptomyces kaniharaensis]
MTAFVLVPGHFTGGWIWREVGDRLREAGAEVYEATLTGSGDAGLETHIADVLRLVDAAADPELVLVGHEYGIHPVLGAADRRAGRTTRIVYLDAGLPKDGDRAVQLVPDQAARELLLDPARTPADGLLPAPGRGEWHRWGSVAGLSGEALDRLTALAAAQPVATLTEPLRLSGALAAVPTSGIFCTAGGTSIATVEAVVASGMPQFRFLADPRVGFFDLDTGHWPMLSCPDDLAGVLLRAAAGEGHRIAPPPATEVPTFSRPHVLDTPEHPLPDCPRERIGNLDLYFPESESPLPAILFVHGGPVPADLEPTPRDWPMYVGNGRYAASLGVVGATAEHRLHHLHDYPQAAEDLAAAVDALRAHPRVDGERIALWFFSGGGLLTTDWLAAPPSWLRCLAANYPILAPLPGWDAVDPHFRPVEAVAGAGRLPIVLTRAGLESEAIATTVAQFVTAAVEHKADLELIDVPNGHHGFEVVDHIDEVRDALAQASASVLRHLRA